MGQPRGGAEESSSAIAEEHCASWVANRTVKTHSFQSSLRRSGGEKGRSSAIAEERCAPGVANRTVKTHSFKSILRRSGGAEDSSSAIAEERCPPGVANRTVKTHSFQSTLRRSGGVEGCSSATCDSPRCSSVYKKPSVLCRTAEEAARQLPNRWGSKCRSVYQKIGGGGTTSCFKLTMLKLKKGTPGRAKCTGK